VPTDFSIFVKKSISKSRHPKRIFDLRGSSGGKTWCITLSRASLLCSTPDSVIAVFTWINCYMNERNSTQNHFTNSILAADSPTIADDNAETNKLEKINEIKSLMSEM